MRTCFTTVANLACGPVSIGDRSVANGNSATLQVPAGLAANYNLTLPTALPASLSLMTMTAAGIISTFAGIGISGANLTLPGNLTFTGTIAGAGLNGALTNAGSTPVAIVPDINIVAGGGLAYWRDASGIVHVKGAVTNSTGGNVFGLVTTNPLPAGFRPASQRIFTTNNQSGTLVFYNLTVTSTGQIQSQTAIPNGTVLFLDCISFLAEA